MTQRGYLRYPHVHEDLVTFVAEDDVWLAPLTGGRAWRVSSLNLPARNPRFTADGRQLVWTVTRGAAPEVVTAGVDGSGFRQLTFFGHASTRNKGFLPDGRVLVTSSFEQGDSRLAHGYAVPLAGGASEPLGYGPLEAVSYGPELGDEKPVVLGTLLSREPAWWKRYRGGTGGKLWIDRDGNGEFVRLAAELNGNLTDPLWLDGRIHFLSDHEGYGNIYSIAPDGSGLRRHTDHESFYARHASTDGRRIVFESAGELFLLEEGQDQPRKLEIELGSTGAQPKALDAAKQLREAQPDHSGDASLVISQGALHWLRHQDGPARALESESGVRARLPRFLADGRLAYLHDRSGEEVLRIASLLADGEPTRPEPAATVEGEAANAHQDGHPELPRPVPARGTAPEDQDPANDQDPGASENGIEAEAGEGPGADDTAAARDEPAVHELTLPSRVVAVEASPDGQWLLLGTAFGDLLLVDSAGGTSETVVSAGSGSIEHLAWAPDSSHFAWAQAVDGHSERKLIRLRARPAGSDIIDVTDGRFIDSSPSFSTDGKFLAFLSGRSLDPVYDEQRFDLAFPHTIRPYLVTLSATEAAPFGPAVVEAAPQGGAGRSEKDTEPAVVVLDADGLSERIVALPVGQGNYEQLRAVPGALLYLDVPTEGVLGDGRARSDDEPPTAKLVRLDLAGGESKVLAEDVASYRLSGDGKQAALRSQGKLRTVPTSQDGADPKDVDLSRIRVTLEPRKVWRQQFREAWRLQRDFFWDETMGGLDWEEIHERYQPVLDRVGSFDDLVDLLWELHGELGTSHAYVRPPEPSEAGAGKQGFLGAELAERGGEWSVSRLLLGDSSDPQALSPLRRPGVAVRAGDTLLAVDGQPVGGPEARTPAELLRGSAGKAVELTVRAEDGTVRRTAVVPLGSEERLRYQDWVQTKRRVVAEASGGRFGYLHIPDMQAHGWAQLHRDLETEAAKDALVIDVRRNRGGHTSQLVAELIGRTVDAWTVSRGEYPTTYPYQAVRGPVVVITDEFAGSDGDIITQVVKMRGIGPVIGTRTWGGVIGIDMKFDLVDGTPVSQPRYAHFFEGGTGWGVENYGVDPDIEILFPPHAHKAGTDPQLEHGIGVLKEMLQEIPTKVAPSRDKLPRVVPAPLPPRRD
ncbi:S41 family peptidase [Arthrobacter sp. NPDC090010]|uniref:S41 family peptidase n=1 Tax=Arthrobacter sp. NPDC090010 TaxID=3363942 RepID=UPI00381BD17C